MTPDRNAFQRGPIMQLLCQWFALCTRPADVTVWHPVLGSVSTCQRCVDTLGLTAEKG